MSSVMKNPVRKQVWLTFDGTMSLKGKLAILRPREDPRCYNVFDAADVRQIGDDVQVHIGAKIRKIYIPEDSAFAESGGATHPECGGATRCFGRLEECCVSGEIVGNCAGKWGC